MRSLEEGDAAVVVGSYLSRGLGDGHQLMARWLGVATNWWRGGWGVVPIDDTGNFLIVPCEIILR